VTKLNVKKGDKVKVLSGKDKGKSGKVLQVIPKDKKVLIEGINLAVKHKKPRSHTQQGGILHQESPIDISKAMVICKGCGEPTRVGRKALEDGSRVRVCKHCNEQLDS
jgi:large subunit ribosomal protein L24